MALQKKKYRCSTNRSRGGVPGQCVDSSSASRGKTKKDYSKQVRGFHGSNTDAIQDALHKEIVRKKTYA